MTTINNIIKWGNEHYKPWMAPVRMLFGFLIVFKGLYFIQHSDYIIKWSDTGEIKDVISTISIIFAILYILLGCQIIIGLTTRISSAAMIPVIITSIFFTNPH